MPEITHAPEWADKGTYKEPQGNDNVRAPRFEVDNATTYIDKDGSNNLTLTDAVTGTKTLAQLASGVTDHGELTGLDDDDHTHYLLVNGTRALTGNLIPDSASTRNLGSASAEFQNIYIGTGSVLLGPDQEFEFSYLEPGDNIKGVWARAYSPANSQSVIYICPLGTGWVHDSATDCASIQLYNSDVKTNGLTNSEDIALWAGKSATETYFNLTIQWKGTGSCRDLRFVAEDVDAPSEREDARWDAANGGVWRFYQGITLADTKAINTTLANDDYFTLGAVDNDTSTITEIIRLVGASAPHVQFSGSYIDINSLNLANVGYICGDANSIYLNTHNQAGADTTRLSISTGADTAVATWASITHSGVVLGGQLNLNGQTFLNTGTITFPTDTCTLASTADIAATKLDDLSAPDDNTDLNASTSAHGLLLKLDNDSGHFLNGQGSWATPAGGGTVDTSGTPEANDYARFTDADTIEGRSYAEVKSDLDLEIGTDVLAQQAIGIADDNLVEVDDADAADNDYAKFTANGLEGRSYTEVKTDLSLDNVENTAVSSWAGSANITTVGTLASGDADAVVSVASDSTAGKVELATAAETTTGTDATRAVTPDGLAGSDYGKRVIQVIVIDSGTAVTTGDGKAYFFIPSELNGYNLVDADAGVNTASTSGTPTVAIYNVTDSQDMLSTNITIDENEKTSYTAATQPVINGSYDDVATGDELRIDVDVAGTGTKGLSVILSFQLP